MRITIENLPPIASGSFEVRPLTIFIGPNNTGKSRAGQLAWAFARVLDRSFVSTIFPRQPGNRLSEPRPKPYDASVKELIRSKFANHISAINETLNDTLDLLIGFDFEWTGGTVVYQGEHGARFSYEFGPKGTSILSNLSDIVPEQFEWQSLLAAADHGIGMSSPSGDAPDEQFWRRIRTKLRYPGGNAFYLPAGRGAFASTWAFYAGLSLRSSGIGNSDVNLPTIAAEFLRTLLDAAVRLAAAKGGDPRLISAVDLLEQDLIEGRVAVAGTPSLPFPLVFSNVFADEEKRFTIELSKASSSVNELGPVAMILKTLVKPGDLVVIDEPEAHLHPENHRLIAHVLVRLAAAGVTVIAPTHSSTIIHQISNLVRANKLDATTKRQLGLEPNDTLSHEQVGIYEFDSSGDRVAIKEVRFEEDFGYPEEEFYNVAVALTRETSSIDAAIPG